MAKKPNPTSSLAERELDRLEGEFNEFQEQIKGLAETKDAGHPKEDQESNTKLSQNQIANSKDIYLKPKRTIGSPEKGMEKLKDNPKYQEFMKFAKENVYFIAENHEIIGEMITKWTKPGPGFPAQEWEIPVNTPVWGPRYLAEELKNCSYTVYEMQENAQTGADGMGTYTGRMVAKKTKQRLDAIPASKRKSIFMGHEGF